MNVYIIYILKCFYFLLPAAIANMVPFFLKGHLGRLGFPLDLGRKLFGQRILGKNKTFGGAVGMVLAGIVVAYLQTWLYGFEFFRAGSFVDYGQVNVALFGFLVGFGVMAGDAAGAFVKRRFGIAPGRKFVPMDQLDSVVVMLLLVSLVWPVGWRLFLVCAVIWFFGHLGLRRMGYLLGLSEEKF